MQADDLFAYAAFRLAEDLLCYQRGTVLIRQWLVNEVSITVNSDAAAGRIIVELNDLLKAFKTARYPGFNRAGTKWMLQIGAAAAYIRQVRNNNGRIP